MDIGYKTSKGNFSLWSAALAIHDNRQLVAQNDKVNAVGEVMI